MKNMFKKVTLTVAVAAGIFFAPIAYNQVEAAQAVDTITQQQEAQPAVNKTAVFQETAKKYLGIRYTYGGTTTKGFDCSGYVMTVMKQLGVALPRTSKAMYGAGSSVTKANLQPGDLMFFSATPGSKNITHVGIYYGDGKFIHSQTSKGVSMTAVNDKWYWGSRFVGAKRVLN